MSARLPFDIPTLAQFTSFMPLTNVYSRGRVRVTFENGQSRTASHIVDLNVAQQFNLDLLLFVDSIDSKSRYSIFLTIVAKNCHIRIDQLLPFTPAPAPAVQDSTACRSMA